jgi:hypothetical protein
LDQVQDDEGLCEVAACHNKDQAEHPAESTCKNAEDGFCHCVFTRSLLQIVLEVFFKRR